MVLLDVGPVCVYSESFVLWRDGSDWQIRSLEPLLNDGGYAGTTVTAAWPHRPDGSMAVGPTARTVAVGPIVTLGVIYGESGCGSGPHASYLLLSLEDREWTLEWNASTSSIRQLGHTSVEFAGEGIEELIVHGSSWFRPDNVFGESNSGPHRLFEQRWVREGDAYVMAAEEVAPAAYNTLVEFVRRLGSGDQAGATALVTNLSLVATAQRLGLTRGPEEPLWIGYCTDGGGYAGGPFAKGPCIVEKSDGQRFRFDMVESAGDWLISDIVAER